MVSLVATFLIAVPTSPASAAVRVPGIDVSKWQGDVDWTDVASTPVRFVIMRATIGNTASTVRSVDPKYAEYLAGATANGLVVGAYHRANVGRAEDDAWNEANYFVNNAQIAAGDVLPVLDIEQTHGLSVAEMQEWVREWVQRVFARTGVKPMIYSSPNFWQTNMGNTPWFADHGYPLWIAHWGVSAPIVPAGNWGGQGWTFWQWTSTGHVDGIASDVDRDRFKGTSLARGKIASLEVTPPDGGAITGARIDCGGAAIDVRPAREPRHGGHARRRRPIRAPRCSAGPGRAPRQARRRRATSRCSARRRSRPCSATPSPSSIRGAAPAPSPRHPHVSTAERPARPCSPWGRR